MSTQNDRREISRHIFPTSATMVRVCVTVIGIVRLTEITANVSTIIGNVLAMNGVLFLACCLLSCLSLRSERYGRRLERHADLVFLGVAKAPVVI